MIFFIESVLHDKTNVHVINSTHSSSKYGGVSIEEGPHVMDALVVWFAVDHREGLVHKICNDLVKIECHCFDLKVSYIGALG